MSQSDFSFIHYVLYIPFGFSTTAALLVALHNVFSILFFILFCVGFICGQWILETEYKE